MWLTPDIAYIHMPKTGGTFTAASLRDLCGAKLVHGQHDPVWLYPDELEGRTVYGTCRDPYSWYLSLYIHSMNADEERRTRLSKYGNGHTGFHDFLYGATHPHTCQPPKAVGVIWEPADGAGEAFRFSGVGLWTWATRYMYGERSLCETGEGRWMVDVLLNQAHVAHAFQRLFGASVAGRPAMNTRESRQGRFQGPPRYSDWLNDDARRWIAEADGELASFFGLKPCASHLAPAWWGLPC